MALFLGLRAARSLRELGPTAPISGPVVTLNMSELVDIINLVKLLIKSSKKCKLILISQIRDGQEGRTKCNSMVVDVDYGHNYSPPGREGVSCRMETNALNPCTPLISFQDFLSPGHHISEEVAKVHVFLEVPPLLEVLVGKAVDHVGVDLLLQATRHTLGCEVSKSNHKMTICYFQKLTFFIHPLSLILNKLH